jgi:hypothetical protein
MLLTHCINLLPGLYHGLHLPTIQAIMSHVIGKSTNTYQCIIQLDTLIDLDWNALWQFNCIKGQNMHEAIFTSSSHTPPSEPCQISNLCASQYVIDCVHKDGAAILVNVWAEPEINVTSIQGLNALTNIDILAHDQHALMSKATSTATDIFDTEHHLEKPTKGRTLMDHLPYPTVICALEEWPTASR